MIYVKELKFSCSKSHGKLQSLPIHNVPWEDIVMNFITSFPTSPSRHDNIWTIVDRFSKQTHFVPFEKTQGAPKSAHLFIKNIFIHYGMPKLIANDHNPKFTGKFWIALFENIGGKLNFSTSFHPQTYEKSEVTNISMLDLLKTYVINNQIQLKMFLPLVEFTYNNTAHFAIGKHKFQLFTQKSQYTIA